ncbi:MAG: hypothetical protein RLZ98_3049 [Pseudomonadota bacterium]|jgi:hypothetical protein
MKIFISYRRQDSQYAAGRLDDYLSDHFGRNNVFFDTNTIEGGHDFREKIATVISETTVFLPIIGPTWLTLTSENGIRRIEDPNDLVRFEIETALKSEKRIIPIFLTAIPNLASALPPQLSKLADLHGIALRPGRDFRSDAIHLMRDITALDQQLPSLLGQWHCRWIQTSQPWLYDDMNTSVWETEDVVDIHELLGHRLYAKGLNHKQGSFNLEGWWSELSVSFVFSGLGRDEGLKGTVALRLANDSNTLEGVWAQYVASENKMVGGPTIWNKMSF